MVAHSLGWSGTAPWLRLDAEATALDGSQALFLYVLMVSAGQAGASEEQARLAGEAFWALDGVAPSPTLPIFGGASFDPADWRGMLAALLAKRND
jgi:hypothetical protein